MKITYNRNILCGADRIDQLLPMLEGKSVALCVNHSSILRNRVHIADTLLKHKINITKFFTPEHGLRGNTEAGLRVDNSIDPITKIKVISLYGKNKKPTNDQFNDVDIVVFDLQDVGARFYTYISTLHYVMEACAENNKKVIVLDRPNPNGFYVDGPVLDTAFHSFIGMHPVPIVHGLTIGEYAKMINGEGWLNKKSVCPLTVIVCENYSHKDFYLVKNPPSPNLTSMQAIFYYPTTCLFEGTQVSVGRGTKSPFRNLGMPQFKKGRISFTPYPSLGAKNPIHKGKSCSGIFISDSMVNNLIANPQINLDLIRFFYDNSPDKKIFFDGDNSFEKLVGNNNLKQQIIEGKTNDEIRKSWLAEIVAYKVKRKKYLLYSDYE